MSTSSCSTGSIKDIAEELRRKAGSIDVPCHCSLFVDIPSELKDYVERLLSFPPAKVILIDKFSVQFKHHDLLRLNSRVWLNDEVVNFFMKLFEERECTAAASNMARKSNLFMNSFFYFKLTGSHGGFNYNNVKKWTKNQNVFSYNLIFIPINAANHWTMVCVSIPTREIMYLNSLSSLKDEGKTILMNIVMWLKLEFESKSLSGPFLDFNVKNVRCPQQLNTDDCGVFILAYADLLSNELDLDIMTQSLADGVRKLIAFWIVRGYLVLSRVIASYFEESLHLRRSLRQLFKWLRYLGPLPCLLVIIATKKM